MKMYDNFSNIKLNTLTLLLGMQVFSAAAEVYTPSDLTNATQAWLQQQSNTAHMQIRVHPLDMRSKNRECSVPLQFSLVNPKLQTQNSVKILCDAEQGWQLYLSAKISQMIEVVVTRRQLPPGSVLTGEMIEVEARDQFFSRGAVITDPLLIEGARTKRAVNLGQILTLQDLCLVCKGDMVTIEGISDSLVVATSGKALSDGSLGDSIQVQNLNSGRKVQASVTAVKKVAINL
jgi:flagella basal body P-ring formation protein FlgA